jgi:DNA-directed RNA polymerase subunit RPC12/RpoP
MGRVTDRYCCLGCGRFWRVPDFEIAGGHNYCPYCGDMYWVDNVQPNEPPPLYEEREVKTPCFHKQVVECFGDMNFCTICGAEFANVGVGEKLIDWQLRVLERLMV